MYPASRDQIFKIRDIHYIHIHLHYIYKEDRDGWEVGSLDYSTWTSNGRVVLRRALIEHSRACTRPLGSKHSEVELLKCV